MGVIHSFEGCSAPEESDDRCRTANACYKDAADLFAELDRFQEAMKLYDQVADYSLGSALTKYSVKEYWLRGGLCALAAQVSLSHLDAVFGAMSDCSWGFL